MSRVQTLTPEKIEVIAPGDGNRVLLLSWPEAAPIEQVIIVLSENASKTVGEGLIAPHVLPVGQMPAGRVL